MAYFGFKDLSSLSSVDMTIYRYVTQHHEQVIYMRVRDIANNAHVSNSSVMRFIHKIGFNSFPEFKAYFKTSSELNQAPNQLFHFFDKSNFPVDIESRVRLVADYIYNSDNIVCFGMGSSGYLAGYTARKLASIGFNSCEITDPSYPLPTKFLNTSNNVIICFSVSGETNEIIEALNPFITDPDTQIIAITGNETSTLARMSMYCLTYNESEKRVNRFYDLSSQIPPMYLSEGIMNVLREKNASESNTAFQK